MHPENPANTPLWHKLHTHAAHMQHPENHLQHLLDAPNRLQENALRGGGLFYDFSRQRINARTRELLLELAAERKLALRFAAMMRGEKVNITEQRAALHTACRSFSQSPVLLDGTDVLAEIRQVRNQIRRFSAQVRSGEVTGSSGEPFRHVVVVGIGGSYLGTQFVSTALADRADGKIKLHYLSNVDIHNFGRVVSAIDPQTTLWVVISKSYTTAETLANARQAAAYMEAQGLDFAKHLVTVTSKGSPGDDPHANPALQSFHMFDFIGGRYSVSSAVGGVPLSLYLGYGCFEAFLKGAEEMDQHALNTPPAENLPLTAALIAVWNNNFLGYPAQAIIPYATPLAKLAPHIQQLNMESNGKSASIHGQKLSIDTGMIIFGEPGTNAQHSFFQLAHQGRPFPIDFIGVIHPQYPQFDARSRQVSNHQELWANLIAQPAALAEGRTSEDAARCFPGNRPSSTILLQDLAPENIGRLLAFYEARTVFESFVWGTNAFDQFGVELGKSLANGNRREIALKNDNPDYNFEKADPIARFYLQTLFKGKW